MTEVERNLTALQEAVACWNAGDRAGYVALYAEEAVLRGYPGVAPGLPGIRAFYAGFWTAFPASRLLALDVFGAGDRVVCRFEVQGTHDGPFQGLPATGRPFVLPGITILRFAEGRCVERWSQTDFLSLLQQLGAMPAPVETPVAE